MTIQQIEYVLALDKHRHFVKAAESCFVSQPTLTLQVKKLESEIGLKIFDRSTQPLEVTDMGEKFISKAKEIHQQVSFLKDMVKKEKEDATGILRLAIIPTLAPYLLPRFLKDFTDKNPNVFLEIEELESEQIIEKLNNGSLDMGLMSTPLEEKNLKETILYKEPFLVYASKDHPLFKKDIISKKDLSEEGLWLLKEGHCFRNQVLDICNQDKLIDNIHNFSFESNSIRTLKNLIRYSSGYTLVPELSVDKLDTPYLRNFEEKYKPIRDISVVTNKTFTKEKVLNNLRKSILDNIPDSFKKNEYFVTVKWR